MSAAETTTPAVDDQLPIPGWCLLERRNRIFLGGYVEEVQIAGARYLKLNVPDADGGFRFTRFYNAAVDIASIVPCDEATATAKAIKQWAAGA